MGVMDALMGACETYGAVVHLTTIVATDAINAAGGVNGLRLEFLRTAFQSLAQCRDAGLNLLSGCVDDDVGVPGFILPVAHLTPRG